MKKTSEEKLYWSDSITPEYINIQGCVIRYITTGNGQPLLLLHTIRTQLSYFKEMIPVLSGYFKVYALDLPGHGQSCIERHAEYTEPYMRKIMVSFIEALQLSNVTILGESIGATLALTIASTDDGRKIQKVYASNPYDYGYLGGIRRSSRLSGLLFTIIHWPLFDWIVSHAAIKPILKNVFEGGFYNKKNFASEFLSELYNDGKRKGYPRAFKSLLRNWKSWLSAKAQYSNIRCPVVLIYGDSDWSDEEDRAITRKLITQNEFSLLKNTGHFSCLDNPQGILKIVLKNK